MTQPVTAIVLAGGRASKEFAAETGVTNRALVELIAGRTMLDFVLQALYGSKLVGQVIVVGDIPVDKLGAAPADRTIARIVQPGESLIDNVLIGLNATGSGLDESVLLVSADIPFVTADAIDGYTQKAVAAGADFCYPIIAMEHYNRQFAGMKRTTLKLREGEFTGGNIMLVRAGVLTANPDAIRRAYAGRKSVLRIGGMLGWGLLLRMIVSQLAAPGLLNIALLERAVGRLLGPGVSARAIVTEDASIGTDVDRAQDVVFARERLRGVRK